MKDRMRPRNTVPVYCPLVELAGTDDSAAGSGFRIRRIRTGIKHHSQKTDLFLCLISDR